jgi:hypothetical protein
MIGRVDQNVYGNGLATMLGWLPLLQGPATAAPGTLYVETAAGPCILVDFEFNPTQGYVIEASALKFRFYTNDARIETAPGVTYEVAHPYTLAELQQLDLAVQRRPLHGGREPQADEADAHVGAVTFSLADLELKEGPIDAGNADETITVHTNTTGRRGDDHRQQRDLRGTDVGSLFRDRRQGLQRRPEHGNRG